MFIVLILICFFSAQLLTRRFETLDSNKIYFLSLNFFLGFSSFILLSHLLSFVTQSYSLSTKISFSVFTLLAIYSLYRFKFDAVKVNLTAFAVSIVPGLMMFFRQKLFGNPDRIHAAIISSVAENDIYPPLSPVGKNFSMADYHYGTDLIGASIKTLTGFSSYEALNLQVALGAVLTFLAIYALVQLVLDKKSWNLATTVVIFFFTSVNSLEFFLRELFNFSNFGFLNFLKSWLVMSWTSISHLTSQLRLPSQNIVMGFVFTLVLLLLIYFKSKDKSLLYLITPLSFIVYFCYPAFWYPVAAASFLLLIWQKTKWQEALTLLVLFYVGKVLCFNQASADPVSVLVFKPSLEWINWGKSYLTYFYDRADLAPMLTSYDPTTGQRMLAIPLLSSISFRDFGFSILLGSIFFVIRYIKKQISERELIYFAGMASSVVPFLIQFILRPIETTRFLLIAKLLLLIYALISLVEFIYQKNKPTKIIASVLALIMIVPGIVSITPDLRLSVLGNKSMSALDKARVEALTALHKSGDVALDSRVFDVGSQFSGLAGFYSIGGQVYKSDQQTIATAMDLMNPKLLEELEVNYVMVYPDTKLTELAKSRLNDKSLFKLHDYPEEEMQVYEFIAKEISAADEYRWALGYPDVRGFQPVKNNQGKLVLSLKKKDLEQAKLQLKEQLAQKAPIQAAWLNIQAIKIN